MRGVWLEEKTPRFRDDLPRPEPGPGEALLRLRLAGVCGTDVELCRGYYPFAGVPGHEFVAEVVRADGAPKWVGSRVVGEINAVCGRCPTCRAGRPTHCEDRTVLGIVGRAGVFAEYFTLPVDNLHAVPEGLADEAAVFCEPLAAALQVAEQVHLRPTLSAVVVGAGRLGLLVGRVLGLAGCQVQVVVRSESRAELAARFGLVGVSAEELRPGRADLVVEASGAAAGFALARKLVRPRGTLVLKSTYAGELCADFSSVVVDEISLLASRCGPFAPALRLLERGLVDPRPLIQDRRPLDAGAGALTDAARPGATKILLHP